MTVTKERWVRNTCKVTGDICLKSGGQLKLATSAWCLFCNGSVLAEADDQCPLIITRLCLRNQIAAIKILTLSLCLLNTARVHSLATHPFPVLKGRSDYIYPRKQ